LDLLATPGLPRRVTTTWLGQKLKIEWRTEAKHLIKVEWFQEALSDLGWKYVAKKGKGGAYFETTKSPFAVAEISKAA
jgi:hypothetical protein